jgi:hypothetical protein
LKNSSENLKLHTPTPVEKTWKINFRQISDNIPAKIKTILETKQSNGYLHQKNGVGVPNNDV